MVTVLVHDLNHKVVSSATVLGTWSNNPGVVRNCTTNRKGTCTLMSDTLTTAATVTFTVTGISHASLSYNVALNHDPEADSNGTTITISRPY
jgi:hypothetical protein